MRPIPPEIWLEVIEDLPCKDLPQFSLTDRILANGAASPLPPFRLFTVRRRAKPSGPARSRDSRLVREAGVQPHVAVEGDSEGDPLDLLNELARELHRFSNLRALHIGPSCAIQTLMDQVATMALRELSVIDPHRSRIRHALADTPGFAVAGSPTLRISKATFGGASQQDDCGIATWSKNPSSVPVFRAVKQLSIALLDGEAQNWRDILPKFPNVNTFIIRESMYNPDDAFPDVYAGCSGFMSSVRSLETSENLLQPLLSLASPNLTHLSISPVRHMSGDELVTRLTHAKRPSVISLKLRLEGCKQQALAQILERFPATQQLNLTIIDVSLILTAESGTYASPIPQATALFKSLPDILGSGVVPNLSALAISYMFMFPGKDKPWKCEPLLDGEAIRDTILASHPPLTSLGLGGHDFLIRWRRDRAGYVEKLIIDQEPPESANSPFWATFRLGTWWESR
ncbi:hypothetical protein MKEN_00196500 [Mycena kentingensis (nom. inval.)]|nr:hypothetical protein MKEN_00196500 [Mycena kentingensis (nom. inval.)]